MRMSFPSDPLMMMMPFLLGMTGCQSFVMTGCQETGSPFVSDDWPQQQKGKEGGREGAVGVFVLGCVCVRVCVCLGGGMGRERGTADLRRGSRRWSGTTRINRKTRNAGTAATARAFPLYPGAQCAPN